MTNIDPLFLGLIDTSLLVWAILQITVVALVTYGLALGMRQVTPGSSVFVCGLGLLCMSILPSVTMMRSSGWSWGEWISNAISVNRLPDPQSVPAAQPDIRDESGSQRRDPMEAIMLATATTRATQLLDSVKISENDKQVVVKAEMESGVIAIVETLLPALLSARKAAQRMQSANNLKQLMLALHNYAATYNNRFPAAIIVDAETGMERSWRVEILPFLDQQQLYAQYRKDEPWDSEANMKVLEKMPAVFALPGLEGTTQTPYQTFVNDGGGLTPGADGKGPKFAEYTDGLSNTLVLVETLPLVPWTKPVDVTDAMAARTVTIRPGEAGFNVARGDGSVVFISNTIDPEVWKALITRAGGEVPNINP